MVDDETGVEYHTEKDWYKRHRRIDGRKRAKYAVTLTWSPIWHSGKMTATFWPIVATRPENARERAHRLAEERRARARKAEAEAEAKARAREQDAWNRGHAAAVKSMKEHDRYIEECLEELESKRHEIYRHGRRDGERKGRLDRADALGWILAGRVPIDAARWSERRRWDGGGDVIWECPREDTAPLASRLADLAAIAGGAPAAREAGAPLPGGGAYDGRPWWPKGPAGRAGRVVLDTETTGLSGADEILSLSIVDGDGRCLLDRRYRPERAESWDDAAEVNGIWPEDVSCAGRIADDVDEISGILARADEIVVYNADFDLYYLRAAGIDIPADARIVDAMIDFSSAYGEWSEWWGDWRWQTLSTAASCVGHGWTGDAHSSLADARACLAVQDWLDKRDDGAPTVLEELRQTGW